MYTTKCLLWHWLAGRSHQGDEADGEAGQVAYLIEGLDDVQILPFYAKELEPRNPIPRKGDEVEPPPGLHMAQS